MIKKIAFVLISVAIGLVTYGQTWQERFTPSNRLDTANYIIGNGSWGIYMLPKSEPFLGEDKFDTIKILMLVCDTSIKINGNSYGLFPNPVGWVNGYEVTLTERDDIVMPPYGIKITHIAWLDERKKHLSKNTIVWLTQKTNQ